MKRLWRFGPLVIALAAVLAVAFGPALAQEENPLFNEVEFLVPEVISVRDHDPAAFTQGFLLYEGSIYESTGRYGESTLREVNPDTGEVIRQIPIPEEYFAEGLERVGDKLIQLTWTAGEAFVYDINTFEQIGTFNYTGEGWGLCTDGRYLYMSDGSPFIDVRDTETFELVFSGLVTAQGSIVERINELECVGDYIYANVWQTNYIIKIDKMNGVVVAIIDATNLITPEERSALDAQEVLNGIAYNPATDTFLLTGKHWPKMYEVRFVPQE